MSIIRSKDVMDIIFRTLGIVDKEVMTHCEITGYLLYKILDCSGSLPEKTWEMQRLLIR